MARVVVRRMRVRRNGGSLELLRQMRQKLQEEFPPHEGACEQEFLPDDFAPTELEFLYISCAGPEMECALDRSVQWRYCPKTKQLTILAFVEGKRKTLKFDASNYLISVG